MITVLLLLIVLHRSDGGEVMVNAEQITSLRSPAGHLGRLSPGGRCIVNLVDGKFIAVLEACETVRQLAR